MEPMLENESRIRDIAQHLSDHKGEDTVALYIGEASGFTDYFVITTVTSMGHMRGLVRQLGEHLRENGIVPLSRLKHVEENGWTLIDCGFVVIHLMTREMREFYDLERLWFHGKEVFHSSSSSSARSS